MTKETGGPAFPVCTSDNSIMPESQGMSLRDWFAGMALQSYTAQHHSTNTMAVSQYRATEMAESAYMLADEMLKAREV